MAGIFISYRRDDSAGYAGWLYERLAARFGSDLVFMDVDSIEAGVDFVEIVQETVGKSGAVVALIGPQWLTVADRTGRRRLDDPNDFVRIELRTAMERGVRVIPALVHGAEVPRTEDLPEDLQPLVRRHALELSDARFSYDVRRLIEVLERILGTTGQGPLPAAGAVPDLAGPGTTEEVAVSAPATIPPKRFAVGSIPRPWLWVSLAAALAAIIAGAVLAFALGGSSPKHNAAVATRPPATSTPVPATSTPVPTARPSATRPPATAVPTTAPTSAPVVVVTSTPIVAPTSTPASTRPTSPPTRTQPTSRPAVRPTTVPTTPPPSPATVAAVHYVTLWQNGLAGWHIFNPAVWPLVGKVVRYTGGGIDQIIAPVKAPRGPYFVQANMRVLGCRAGRHGFGVYVRIPNGAADGNDGIFGGSWTTYNGLHWATLWSLNGGFYRETVFVPGTRFNVYRLVVRGNTMRLFINKVAFLTATVPDLASARQVGIGSLNCNIQIAGFRLESIK